MALIRMVSFDTYGAVADMLADGWYQDVGIDFSTTGGRFGGGAIVESNGSDSIKFQMLDSPTTNTIVIGWSWYLEVLPSYDAEIALIQEDNGDVSIQFYFKTNGEIDVLDELGNLVGTFIPPLGTWFRFEVKVDYSATAAIEVRIDESTVLNGTADTDNFNGTGFQVLQFESGGVITTDGYRVDDLIVADTTGTVNNDFFGDIRMAAVFPSGAGSSAQFTPNGVVNNYEAVDETGSPDGDTTYNRSETLADRDLFAMGDLPEVPASIIGVQTGVVVRKDDTGGKNFAQVLKSGTTVDVGTAVSAANSYQWNQRVLEVDPDTGTAWTEAAINAIEAGYEVA